jgi:hypothetical protein
VLTLKFGKSVDLTKLTENTKNMHRLVDLGSISIKFF